MSSNKREKVMFLLDRLPKGIILIGKDRIKFLLNAPTVTLAEEESGFLYSSRDEVAYKITKNKKQVTSILEPFISETARHTESPILKVNIGTTNLKQAILTVYQSTNPELEGKSAVEVELKEGYTYEDIPWLPAFCIQDAQNEFEALKEMFEALQEIHKNNLEEKRRKEQEKAEAYEKLEALYTPDEDSEILDKDEDDSDDFYIRAEDKVYTVETDNRETLMATDNRKQALLYGEEKLAYYHAICIKTWVNSKNIKTVTLSEG